MSRSPRHEAQKFLTAMCHSTWQSKNPE